MADASVLADRQAHNALSRTADLYPLDGESPVTFRHAALSYLQHGGEARYLDKVMAYFGDRPLATIHPFDIRKMAETLYDDRSNATKNRQAITPTRAVLMHAYDRGWCNFIRVKRFKEDKPAAKKPASAVWLHAFCRECDRSNLSHLAALVLFMAQTGARISEAVNLKWREVDLTGRSAVLLKTKTSTNSVRYLTDELCGRLRRMQGGQGPDDRVFRYRSRHSVNERIEAVCERADIPYKSPHTCGRKTFATTAIEMGLDIKTTMAAGDWRSSAVFLEIYVQPRQQAGRVVADRLNVNDFGDL